MNDERIAAPPAEELPRKKGLKEYFYEGVMIFLAVVLGFMAENLRQSIIDNSAKRDYIKAYYRSLQQDTTYIRSNLEYNRRRLLENDSVFILMSSPKEYQNLVQLYYYARISARGPTWTITSDRTIIGLKGSEGFKLVNDQNLSELMINYSSIIEKVDFNLSIAGTERAALYPFLGELFDANVFNEMLDENGKIIKPKRVAPLLTQDVTTINQFLFYNHQLKGSLLLEKQYLKSLEEANKELRAFIYAHYLD